MWSRYTPPRSYRYRSGFSGGRPQGIAVPPDAGRRNGRRERGRHEPRDDGRYRHGAGVRTPWRGSGRGCRCTRLASRSASLPSAGASWACPCRAPPSPLPCRDRIRACAHQPEREPYVARHGLCGLPLASHAREVAHRLSRPTIGLGSRQMTPKFPSDFPPPDARPHGTGRHARGRQGTAEAVGRPFVLATADGRGRVGTGRDARGDAGGVCKTAGIAYTGSNPVPATPPLTCGNAAAARSSQPCWNGRLPSARRSADAERTSGVTWGRTWPGAGPVGEQIARSRSDGWARIRCRTTAVRRA
jgi:hypothetical protein